MKTPARGRPIPSKKKGIKSDQKIAKQDPFLQQVAKIPRGKVLTFRELTAAAGSQGMGGMMAASAKVHRIPPTVKPGCLPWWRVIFTGDGKELERLLQNHGGQFGTVGRGNLQKRLLEKEGWRVGSDIPRKVQVLCPDDDLTVYGQAARRGKKPVASLFKIPSMERLVSAQPFEKLASSSENPLGLGSAVQFPLLNSAECQYVLDFMADKNVWDRTVRLDRVNYGKVGIYHYIKEQAYLKKPIGQYLGRLRDKLYQELMRKLPSRATSLKNGTRFPPSLKAFQAMCKKKPYNQKRPSPLIFYYQSGGECYAHQDIFGSRSIAFPYQALIMLTRPSEDFSGGQFYLKDCASGKDRKFNLKEGDCLIFDTGVLASSSSVKHGMTKISKGKRAVFGFAFHMAA